MPPFGFGATSKLPDSHALHWASYDSRREESRMAARRKVRRAVPQCLLDLNRRQLVGCAPTDDKLVGTRDLPNVPAPIVSSRPTGSLGGGIALDAVEARVCLLPFRCTELWSRPPTLIRGRPQEQTVAAPYDGRLCPLPRTVGEAQALGTRHTRRVEEEVRCVLPHAGASPTKPS